MSNEWSVEGVSVWKDANADIGYLKPMFSEGPVTQDGYELNIFDAGSGQDSDLAWSRISPSDPLEIEIAFKRSVLEVSPYFLWGAWAQPLALTSSPDLIIMITLHTNRQGHPQKSKQIITL